VAEVQAYILIQTEVGKAAQVAKEVRDIGGVDAAEDVLSFNWLAELGGVDLSRLQPVPLAASLKKENGSR